MSWADEAEALLRALLKDADEHVDYPCGDQYHPCCLETWWWTWTAGQFSDKRTYVGWEDKVKALLAKREDDE